MFDHLPSPQIAVATKVSTDVGISTSSAVAVGLGSLALLGGLFAAALGAGIQSVAEQGVDGLGGGVRIATTYTNKATFTLVGKLAGFTGRGFDVIGNSAYVATGLGINVIDITNPSTPTLSQVISSNCSYPGALPNFCGYADDVKIYKSHLLALLNDQSYSNYSIKVLDISTSSPVVIGTVNGSGKISTPNTWLTIDGDQLYIQKDDGFDVVDLLDLSNPKIIASYQRGASDPGVSDLTVSNGYVYLARISRVSIFDVRNLPALTFVKDFYTQTGVNAIESLYAKNSILYVDHSGVGTVAFNVLDPVNPVLLTGNSTANATNEITGDPTSEYIVRDTWNGVEVIKTGGIPFVRAVGTTSFSSTTLGYGFIKMVGTTIYVTGRPDGGGFFIVQFTPPTDTEDPSINITTPLNNSDVSGPIVKIMVTASDNIGVAFVRFLVDGANVGIVNSQPWEINWDASMANLGAHFIQAGAYDEAGNYKFAPQVNFNLVKADTTAPTVAITSPANNATVAGISVAINATASDNVGVADVKFFVDGVQIGTDTASPFGITVNTTGVPNGTHTLLARAKDTAGNRATSSPITVNVSNYRAPRFGFTRNDFSLKQIVTHRLWLNFAQGQGKIVNAAPVPGYAACFSVNLSTSPEPTCSVGVFPKGTTNDCRYYVQLSNWTWTNSKQAYRCVVKVDYEVNGQAKSKYFESFITGTGQDAPGLKNQEYVCETGAPVASGRVCIPH